MKIYVYTNIFLYFITVHIKLFYIYVFGWTYLYKTKFCIRHTYLCSQDTIYYRVLKICVQQLINTKTLFSWSVPTTLMLEQNKWKTIN